MARTTLNGWMLRVTGTVLLLCAVCWLPTNWVSPTLVALFTVAAAAPAVHRTRRGLGAGWGEAVIAATGAAAATYLFVAAVLVIAGLLIFA